LLPCSFATPEKPKEASTEHDEQKEKQQKNITFSVGDLKRSIRSMWIIDSGATAHMANNIEWFDTITILKVPLTASVGDGNTVPIAGIGTVRVVSTVNGQEIEASLKEVQYIP
jgi:hypothetical protein